jgi:hypothetical protein
MRQITSESVSAFLNKKNFKKQNMRVRFDSELNKSFLFLHGNCIATLKDNFLSITNCGWQSNTTKERLNGLPNVSIHQKNFQWYLNDELWNGDLAVIEI